MLDQILLLMLKPESENWKINDNNVFILDSYKIEIFNFSDWDDVYYVAPELEKNVDEVTRESQIYSIGCLFNRLYVEWLPEGEKQSKMCIYIQKKIKEMMRKNPLKRPKIYEICHFLGNMKGREPTSAEKMVFGMPGRYI